MSKHKIAPAIDLMTQYLEEGYDAERIGSLNRRELAGLIVCPASAFPESEWDTANWDLAHHYHQIIHLAKEALLVLVLEEIADND